MNASYKWVIAAMPLLFMACEDKLNAPDDVTIATSGDDVQFSVAQAPKSRTIYQDNWEEKTSQEIYWGNYIDSKDEFINIYCPNTARGFAKYKVNLSGANSSVAGTVVKTAEAGIQWGDPGVPHTFYAFYPADKAGTSLSGGNTIRATVETGQSPLSYKMKTNADGFDKLQSLASFNSYNSTEYKDNSVTNNVAKTLYGMPDMDAAVMVARRTMTVDQFGQPVPLQFNVLADVLDITLNGPITPNTLGGNANPEAGTEGIAADFIQIQAVTIEVVNVVPGVDVQEYEIDDSTPISGSFDLNMSEDVAGTAAMVSNVSGNASVQLQTSMTEGNGVYYPTLFVRGTTGNDLDHLRLRAFLIPGQITSNTLSKLRIHLQTNCGEFYQMLNDDPNFASGKLYPVKLGYFETRGYDFDLAAWIGQLDPDIYISELSIPGAWHAANSDFQGTADLQTMYNHGVRAFEVHTKNGSTLMKYGDFNSEFDLATATEDFEEPFINYSGSSYSVSNVTNPTVSGTGSVESSILSWTVNGQSYNRRRKVTGTCTVTETRDELSYIVPKFWLRLYRTTDKNETEPLSTAIINLAKIMNPDGLMFVELGADGETGITANYRTGKATEMTRSKDGQSVSGYQYGNKPAFQDIEWSEVYEWDEKSLDGSKIFTDADTWTSTGVTKDLEPNGKIALGGREAWSIAVRSCLERLSRETNTSTGKPVLYSGNLDANTTIRMVQGMVIAKVNTNDATNEYPYLWGQNTPALFSRWIQGSAGTPMTINLQWKAPVAPYGAGTDEPSTYLRWCFTEADNVSGLLGNDALKLRKDAIIKMNEVAAANYAGHLHRTFYESSIGGYLNGSSSAANAQALAVEMNPFLLGRITSPTRQACPLGLVFMNYVVPPSGQEDTYRSAELIRAIINNNRAFILNREGGEVPAVQDNTNSHFSNNPNNPLK